MASKNIADPDLSDTSPTSPSEKIKIDPNTDAQQWAAFSRIEQRPWKRTADYIDTVIVSTSNLFFGCLGTAVSPYAVLMMVVNEVGCRYRDIKHRVLQKLEREEVNPRNFFWLELRFILEEIIHDVRFREMHLYEHIIDEEEF